MGIFFFAYQKNSAYGIKSSNANGEILKNCNCGQNSCDGAGKQNVGQGYEFLVNSGCCHSGMSIAKIVFLDYGQLLKIGITIQLKMKYEKTVIGLNVHFPSVCCKIRRSKQSNHK